MSSSPTPLLSLTNAPPSAPPAAPNAPSPATSDGRPEFIPEKYWDAAAKAPRVEDLGKGYLELSTKLGKGKTAWEEERLARRLENADAYVPAVEGFDPEFLKAHPLTPVLRELAFENGLDQEGFNGLAQKVVGALAAAAPNRDQELAKLGENATARLQAAEHFVTSTFADPAERDALALVASTAAGVKVIEKLALLAKGQPIGDVPPAAIAGAPPRRDRAEINKMMQDPRYYDPRKRDAAFVAEVEQWFASQAA